MSLEDYNAIGKNKIENKGHQWMTKGQEEAVRGLTAFIDAPYDKAKSIYGLIGPGGVGKTFVTKKIVNGCKYSNSSIRCTSPTHKACRVFSEASGLKVETIQSTFGFRLNLNIEDFDYKNPAFNPISKPKLDNIKVLICDEASMLNASLVSYIIRKAQELEIKVIFIGDSFQLSPVKELKSTAFDRCNKVYELTEIVRQGEENPILYLLDLLRFDIANNTHSFLDYISKYKGYQNYNSVGEGWSIMSANSFTNFIKLRFNDEEYTKNIEMYKIIAYRNEKVAMWNNFVRNTIIEDADKNIITKNDLIMSYQTIVNEFNEIIINNSEEYIIKDIVNYVDNKYGFKGFLIKFQMVNGGFVTKPLFIIDHRDKYTITQYVKTLNDLIDVAKKATGGTRATRWKAYYDFKKMYLISVNIKQGNQILYSRDIDYAFAITAHKSQGSTYDNVFVDLTDMVYTTTGAIYSDYQQLLRRVYVACSRARKELIINF